jgi:hypothetical protein
MPFESPADHALGDPSKDWCVHCAREDGSMKSWDECVRDFTAFVVASEGLPEAEARQKVEEGLREMPAWRVV